MCVDVLLEGFRNSSYVVLGGFVYRDVPVVSEGFLGSCKGNRRVFQGVKAFQEQGFMGSHKGLIVRL